jgi:hypothetical protein
MPINKIIVEETIKFTAADKRRQIESALTGVSGSLNEIQDNIDFILKELPNVELPDEILKEVKGLLDDFRAAMPKSIKIEIAKGWWALTQADDNTVLLRDWQEKEIIDRVELTNIYLQKYFDKLDAIVQILQQLENKKYSLARTLIMESVANMLNANQKNFERYKNLRYKLNSIENNQQPQQTAEEIFVENFGCLKCRKLPDASTDYDELPYKKVKTLYDTSHHAYWLSECKFCKQPYLEEFKDEIGWFGGDPMWSYWMPLTPEEFEPLIRAGVDLNYIENLMRKRLFLVHEDKEECKFFWSKQ